MARKVGSGLAFGSLFLILLVACAPAAAPAPPVPAAPQPVPAAPAPSPVDAAWQKVVDAAKKEGTVTVYSFGWTGDIGISIVKAFQEKYGIKVELITGRGAEFVERLKTEQRSGKMVADMFEGGTPHGVNMKRAGLTTASIDLLALKDPGVFEANPRTPDPEGHVMYYSRYLYSPFINTKLVKPGEEPKAWNDLLDPKWKGKMIFASPKVSMEVYMQFWPLKAAGVVDMDYLRALGKQDILWTTGTTEDGQRLSRGERALSIFGTPSTMAQFIIQGAPLRAVSMEPGMSASGTALAAIKGGPHPNATKLLINWMYTPEGQQAHNKPRSTASFLKGDTSFLPEAARTQSSRVVMDSAEILDDEAKAFNDKVMLKEWGLQ